MSCFGDFNSHPDDHIYLSGYGFVSGGDPLHFRERNLRRSAAVIGICLILALLFPVMLFRLAEMLASFIAAAVSLFLGANGLSVANDLYREVRALFLYLFSLALPLLLLYGVLPPPRQTVTVSPHSLHKSTLCALLISLSVGAFTMIGAGIQQEILRFFHLIELNPGSPFPSTLPAEILYILRVVFLPAILEELLLRGCILQALRRHGDTFALFFSALCGGLIHYNLTGDLSNFLLGLVFGYFFLRTGSIRTAMLCHLASNALPFLIDAAQRLLPSIGYRTILFSLLLTALAAGLVGFTLFCRWNHNAFILDDSLGGSLSFGRKLWICLSCIPMAAAVLLWLIQVIRNFQVIL